MKVGVSCTILTLNGNPQRGWVQKLRDQRKCGSKNRKSRRWCSSHFSTRKVSFTTNSFRPAKLWMLPSICRRLWSITLVRRIRRIRLEYRDPGSWTLLHDNAPSHTATLLTLQIRPTSYPTRPIRLTWLQQTIFYFQKLKWKATFTTIFRRFNELAPSSCGRFQKTISTEPLNNCMSAATRV